MAHQLKEEMAKEAAEKEEIRKRRRREFEQKETDRDVKLELNRGLELNPNIGPLPGRLETCLIDLTNDEDWVEGPTARWQNRYVF